MNHTISSTRFARWLAISALAAFACAPRAGKLTGIPAPGPLSRDGVAARQSAYRVSVGLR